MIDNSNLLQNGKSLNVDFDWVRAQLLKTERISGSGNRTFVKPIIEGASKCLTEAKSLILAKFTIVEKKIIGVKNDSIDLEGEVSLSTKWLASYVNGAMYLCIFIVTLGSAIEERASQLMHSGEGMEGYLLDRIGSFAVESLAENFENNLREYYGAKDLSVSMRFSPGYCDWPIEDQFKLAKVLDFSKAGVRLTEGCMMVPKKSISAVVGVGPKDLFSKRISQCDICDKKDGCSYRRT